MLPAALQLPHGQTINPNLTRTHTYMQPSAVSRDKEILLLEILGTVQDIEHTRCRYPLFQPAQNPKPLDTYWFVLPELLGLGMWSRMLLFCGGW